MSSMLLEMPVYEAEAENLYDAEAFACRALLNWRTLAAVMDHSLIRMDATESQVDSLCSEALRYGFATVVTHTAWTSRVTANLFGTTVRVAATIGFPLGACSPTTKRFEAEEAIRLGARELDMVMNLGALKSRHHRAVQNDIRGVVQVANDGGATVKVILETPLLSIDEKILAAELALEAGAHFLKTSTGFSTANAAAHDVELLRGVAGNRCGVKASGGIRTLADAERMLRAGAARLGSSTSVAIVRELGAP